MRKMHPTIIILGVLLLLVAAVVAVLQHPAFGRRMSAQRMARIQASPNWRDGMFRNQLPTPQFTGGGSTWRAAWMMLTRRDSRRVPDGPLPAVRTDLKSLPVDRDWFVWFGHSSYLFQLDGKRFLVDPLLTMAFPASLMLKPFPGTDIYSPDDMPDIDCLIITHEHWDHLDYATLRDLRPKIRHVVCPLGVAEYLEYWGYSPSIISELDWYDQTTIGSPTDASASASGGESGSTGRFNERETLSRCDPVAERSGEITALPSRHFSNRLLRGRDRTLWAAFIVEAGGRKVYVGGDGGYDDRFRRVRERFGTVDLAVMENGQYNPNWAYVHLLPHDLEQAVLDMQPAQVVTVHHDKFALSTHAWSDPDSVARSIADRHPVRILDQPIGTVIYF